MSRGILPPAICCKRKRMAKKKEKITWVDDGRTLSDMSGVPRRLPKREKYSPRASLKEQWQTYIGAVKMMLVPMFTVIAALGVIYMIIWALFFFLG